MLYFAWYVVRIVAKKRLRTVLLREPSPLRAICKQVHCNWDCLRCRFLNVWRVLRIFSLVNVKNWEAGWWKRDFALWWDNLTCWRGGWLRVHVTCGVEMVGGESSWWRDVWIRFKILSPPTFSTVYVVRISYLNSTHRITLNFLCTFFLEACST